MQRKIKLLYIVLDGASDGIYENTSLCTANTPNMDELARISRGGVLYPVGKGVAPESDSAVLNLLGYNCDRFYVGRGPIEALGVGLDLKEGFEVAFRGNLATADFDKGVIIDRRVGRDITTRETKKLVKDLEYIELGIYEGYAKIRVGVDYRVAVVIGSRKYTLSPEVSNTDPAYVKVGKVSIARERIDNRIMKCEALNDSFEARITAELVNKFTEIVNNHLRAHVVNKRRISKGKLPANTILLRDAGVKPGNIPSMKERYGLKFKIIADMPTELGVARLLKIGVIKCPKPTYKGETDYPIRVKKALLALEKVDALYIHLKGPDIYGHDGDFNGKVKSIEDIDRYFISKLLDNVNLDDVAILITMDHSTPPSKRTHTSDPVPFIIYIPGLSSDSIKKFCEKEVYNNGSLGILGYGWMLLPIVKKMIWN